MWQSSYGAQMNRIKNNDNYYYLGIISIITIILFFVTEPLPRARWSSKGSP